MTKKTDTAATVETVETANAALVKEVQNAVGKSVEIERALVLKLAAAMTRKSNPVSVKSVALSIEEGTKSAQLGELRPSMATYLVQVAEIMGKDGSKHLGIAALVALVRDTRSMVASTAKDADLKLSKDEKQGAFSALVETADTVQALRELVPSTVAKPRAKSDASQQGKRTDLEKSKVNQPNLANELIEISERLEQLRENAKSVSESLAHAFNVIEDELHEWQELRWS